MLQSINFSNKLLCLDYTDNYILIGDNIGNIYKYNFLETCDSSQNQYITSNTKIQILFFCNSPVSCIFIYNNDIFYTTWDGDIYKNDIKVHLSQEITKALIIFNNLIYVSLEHNIYILNLNLELLKVLNVPHKVLCFCSTENFIICGFNLPVICVIDTKFNLTTKSVEHDTGILSIKYNNGYIYTGSVDGSLQMYDFRDVFGSDNKMKSIKILKQKSSKWLRNIFNDKLYCSGNEVIYKNNLIYSHLDQVMRVIMLNKYIISIGLDKKMIFYKELNINKEEEDEINKLNQLYGN